MRVFVTGATGFIGEAIVQELLSAGHEVLGLVRSDSSAETLTGQGVTPHRGDLTDTESLAAGARACGGVIHTAFNHDWSTSRDAAAETDRQAVEAMVGALKGSDKPFVLTSGTALLASLQPGPGRVSTETETTTVEVNPRAASEAAALEAVGRGVRVSIVRLPPSVHGAGDHGFVPLLIDLARRTGVAAFVGDGANRWPAVHRRDAAHLFRLALEKASPGARLHAVAEEGIPMRQIAEALGAGLRVPVRGFTGDEAQKHFEWFAPFVSLDNPTSSARTRETFDWSPQGPTLLTDLHESGYFSGKAQ